MADETQGPRRRAVTAPPGGSTPTTPPAGPRPPPSRQSTGAGYVGPEATRQETRAKLDPEQKEGVGKMLQALAEPEKPRVLSFADIQVPGFEARDGDTLVVQYGSVKLPLPFVKVGMMEVGGSIYTRQLRAGDNVLEQYAVVYNALKAYDEHAAKDKVQTWHETMKPKGSGA